MREAAKPVILYNHAYIAYNISMIVKTKNSLEQIRTIMQNQNGIIRSSDLNEHGIARMYLSILEKKGEIQRVSRGIYVATNEFVDEMALMQMRYKRAIFSHETALYLHGLTDRTPLYYSVTVPSGYNPTSLTRAGAKTYFIDRQLYPLGLIMMSSSFGNEIHTYDLERTICDILRSRNSIEARFISESLKTYVLSKSKKINTLYHYAELFRIEKIVRNYFEVLL